MSLLFWYLSMCNDSKCYRLKIELKTKDEYIYLRGHVDSRVGLESIDWWDHTKSENSEPHSPVRGDKVHAEHDALFCVLSTIGGDHHHIAGYLREGALQTHGLQENVEDTWRKGDEEKVEKETVAKPVFQIHRKIKIYCRVSAAFKKLKIEDFMRDF